MRKFQFGLQRVLEFREHRESAAEDDFRAAAARRIAAEAERTGFADRRRSAIDAGGATVERRIALERFLDRVADEERAHEVVIALLAQEEESARRLWWTRRSEAEAMRKLRERAHTRWRAEADRAEQNFLDEFALRRREAA